MHRWSRPYNQAEGTSFQSRVEFQVDNAQLVCSTGVKVSVMALQGRKSSPQKSRPLESGHRRHAVWIAIEYSYKLSQKSEFKFWCELLRQVKTRGPEFLSCPCTDGPDHTTRPKGHHSSQG